MPDTRPVTERDFRMPEFYNADPADYERREDGKIVRKDRWEQGIRSCAFIVGLSDKREGFEISEVVEAVRALGLREEIFERMRTALRHLLELHDHEHPDRPA